MLILNNSIKHAFFAFIDIRGFTAWSTQNQLEIMNLLDITYQCGMDCYGLRRSEVYPKRIVKFLGDGFFSVNEYKDTDNDSFVKSMNEIIDDSIKFNLDFKKRILKSNLHNKNALGIGIGISFGPVLRFNLSGQSIDYAGKVVNIAARLCDVANDGEIVMEEEIEKYFYCKKIKIADSHDGSLLEKELKKIGKTMTFSIKKKDDKTRNIETVTSLIAKQMSDFAKEISNQKKK